MSINILSPLLVAPPFELVPVIIVTVAECPGPPRRIDEVWNHSRRLDETVSQPRRVEVVTTAPRRRDEC